MLNSRRSLVLLLVSNTLASVGTGVAMIAIPWILASQENGLQLFSVLAAIVNIALFLATPFIGPIIDSGSRRDLMLWLRALFIVGLGAVVAINLLADDRNSSLILYYILGSAFYAINIPLRSAYVQELFFDGDYARVNAILEVENQAAAAVTGMIAIFAIAHYGLLTIIVANAIFYTLAMICIRAIRPSCIPTAAPAQGYLRSLKAGVLIAMHRPSLSTMLVAASLPYVVVILFTVLHPVALSGIEGATGSTYALVESLFAVGAILAGLCVAILVNVLGEAKRALTASLFLFAAVVVLQAIFPTYWGFLIFAVGLGVGNALARILRQTLLMADFQSHEVGRMAAFLQSIIMLMRAVFMIAVSLILTSGGITYGLWFAAIIALAAPCIFIVSSLQQSRVPTSQGVL